MSKESAIIFLRELKTNEKAKELLQGREKPKSKEDAIKAYAEVAKELGEDISAEDIAQALEEIEAEIHQKTKAVSADMEELKDDDLGDVAGGGALDCEEFLFCPYGYKMDPWGWCS
jgi:methylaspartate ammonia-lyase